MWQSLLEGGESSQFAWRQDLDGEASGLRKYLTSTGRTASFVPCGESRDCGWRIIEGQFVGRCPEGLCDPKDFERSDLAMVDVDWATLLGDLGGALGLSGCPDAVTKTPAAVQLGWIAPAQSARFPVFFCAPTSFYPAFPMIQRFAERVTGMPFVLVIASRDQLDADSLGLLNSRKAEAVFLDDEVNLDGNGGLEARVAADRLVKFALTTAGVTVKPAIPKFPTPEGAQWNNFTIVEVDGLTIEVRADVRTPACTREERVRYTYEALGLTKLVGGIQVPSSDCAFLMEILHHRRISVDSTQEWDSLRGFRKNIGKLLQEMTGLPSSGAFILHRGRRCYEAAFQVECEPGEEMNVPGPPRRLNREGRVAKSADDE